MVAGGRAHIWDVTAAERRGPATDDAATYMACSADGSVAAVVTGTGTAVWLTTFGPGSGVPPRRSRSVWARSRCHQMAGGWRSGAVPGW